MIGKRLVVETGADAPLRHADDSLFHPLVPQLVQCDEHQRPTLPGCRWRFDQKILLPALLVSALLHRAHPQFVWLRGGGVVRVGDGDGWDGGHLCKINLWSILLLTEGKVVVTGEIQQFPGVPEVHFI